MAILTPAQAETQMDKAIVFHASLVSQYRTKFLTMEADLIGNLAGEYSNDMVRNLEQLRGQLNALLNKANIANFLAPRIRDWGLACGAPKGLDAPSNFYYIKKYYSNTPRTIQSRNISFDTSASITGTGNGQLVRLVTDKDGKNIENVAVENITVECVGDQISLGINSRHQEVFRLRGDRVAENDYINQVILDASNLSLEQEAIGTNCQLLENNNLLTNDATGDVESMFQGWILDDITGVQPDSTNAFIGPYNSTLYSAKISAATREFSQRITTALDDGQPYLPLVVYDKATYSAPSGTQVRLDWGNKNQTLTTSTETGWNYFFPDLDKDLYPENFRENNMYFKFSVPTLASGAISLAMPFLEPFKNNGGTWWLFLPGTIPFIKGDSFGTLGDSLVSSDALTQRYLVYTYGEYINHDTSPDKSDPSLP